MLYALQHFLCKLGLSSGHTEMPASGYEALFGLPDKISWVDACAVYSALLDALAYARATSAGAAVESLLMSNATGSDASPATVGDRHVCRAAVEERARPTV